MTTAEILIVIVCILFAVVLAAAVCYKAVELAKRMKKGAAAEKPVTTDDRQVLEIKQNGTTVHIECAEVNSDGVELEKVDDKED